MKKFVLGVMVFVFSAFMFVSAGTAEAATRVNGYYRSSGTYVNSYYRSSPNSSRFDNYSTQGNYNPYTGKKGYTNPYRY